MHALACGLAEGEVLPEALNKCVTKQEGPSSPKPGTLQAQRALWEGHDQTCVTIIAIPPPPTVLRTGMKSRASKSQHL